MDHLIGNSMADTPLNHTQQTIQHRTITIGIIQHINLKQPQRHHLRQHQPNHMEIECHNHVALETAATTRIYCFVKIILPEVVTAR